MATIEEEIQFLEKHLIWLGEMCHKFEDIDSLFFVENSKPKGLSDDEARCARIAERLGFDARLFRPEPGGPDVRKMLPTCRSQIRAVREMLVKLESEHKSTQILELWQFRVLMVLYDAGAEPLFVDAIEKRLRARKIPISDRTIRSRLEDLRKLGFVFHPRGQRSGQAITQAGIEYVRSHSEE